MTHTLRAHPPALAQYTNAADLLSGVNGEALNQITPCPLGSSGALVWDSSQFGIQETACSLTQQAGCKTSKTRPADVLCINKEHHYIYIYNLPFSTTRSKQAEDYFCNQRISFIVFRNEARFQCAARSIALLAMSKIKRPSVREDPFVQMRKRPQDWSSISPNGENGVENPEGEGRHLLCCQGHFFNSIVLETVVMWV